MDGDPGSDVPALAAEEEVSPPASGGLLGWVPEWFVILGAGFLFAGSMVTSLVTVALAYLLLTGNYAGLFAPLEPHADELVFVLVQFLAATVFQALGIYLTRRRRRWGTVLLACFMGSLALVTIPLTVPALLLLALGKHHFSDVPREFRSR